MAELSKVILDYTPDQWHDYKRRLYAALATNGLHNLAILEDGNAKQFLSNYVDTEFITEEIQNDIVMKPKLNTNHTAKLAHMDVVVQGVTFVFPIINEYKGHYLYHTYYFSKESDGNYRVNLVEVLPKKVIITS